jgi:methionyl-tRNA formyltransferase
MLKIGILSNNNDYLLPYLIKEVSILKNIEFYVFIAVKKKNKIKDKKIFAERTGNFFFKKKYKFNNIKKYQVKSHNSDEFLKIINKLKIDFLYNSETPNKINSKIIKSTNGIINIHPAILPNYRGCTGLEWSLYNNEPIGITAHLMNKKYDAGPIIKTLIIKFKKKDIKKYSDLRIKAYLNSFLLAKKIFENISNNKIKFIEQNEKKAKYYRVIDKEKLNKIKLKIKKKMYDFNKKNLI